MQKKQENLVFGFDVGIGSLGLAVRKGSQIEEAQSLLIDPSMGRMSDERVRRRAYRTRQTHKKREKILAELWEKAGEKPLIGRRFIKENDSWVEIKGDARLEQEFPGKEDKTVYNSALLRIMLLEGKNLEIWQIYKALHSSIQRRGYDARVPWKVSDDDKEAKETEEKTHEFNRKLEEMSSNPDHHYPCYYDAYQMGLWTPKNGIVSLRIIDDETRKVRSTYTASREIVMKEVKNLLSNAVLQVPALQKILDSEEKISKFVGGRLYQGEINALLEQNTPRFDNRAVGHCALIPRYKVCRKEDGLFIRVNFLLGLKNFRYDEISPDGEITNKRLSFSDIEYIYQKAASKWADEKKKDAKSRKESKRFFRMTKNEVKNLVKEKNGTVKNRHEEIKQPDSLAGRCRYSRPALAILHDFILSGKSPKEYYDTSIGKLEECADNREFGECSLTLDRYKFRVNKQDLDFILDMADNDAEFYIPQKTLAELYLHGDVRSDDIENRQRAIVKLIANCSSPMVRHRLTIFSQQLEKMIVKHGSPDHVCIELVREDFMGEEKKKKYEAQSKQGREEKRQAVKDMRATPGEVLDNSDESNQRIEKMRLMREQGFRCVYTDEPLCQSRLDEYEIDHIVPRSRQGPDALYNKVLTLREANNPGGMRGSKGKGDSYPFEWKYLMAGWDAYKKRVQEAIKDGKKKALLLATSEEEVKNLLEKYTGLAVTSHLARLARDLVCLRMGWQPGEKGKDRRVSTISGGLTNKVAVKHEIYKCLAGGNPYAKNRDDKRHHALDAMIISYLPEWARDEEKTGFFKFPKGVDSRYFSEILNGVMPELIAQAKAKLGEQPLGRRVKNHKWDKKRGKYTIEYKMKKQDGYDPYSSHTYKNLHKTQNKDSGHWYTSKTTMGEGSRTHGCLVGLSPQGEPFINPLHAFQSPYKVEKHYEKKGYQVLLLKKGSIIEIPEKIKPIEATQLGGKVILPLGEYRIESELRGDYDIASVESGNDGVYRVKKTRVNNYLMNNKISHCFYKEGGIFDLGSEVMPVAGRYVLSPDKNKGKEICLIKENAQDEFFVTDKKLRSYFSKNIEKVKISLKTGDSFSIEKRKVEAKHEDQRVEKIPSGKYSVKSFAGGMVTIVIESNTGMQYRLASRALIGTILTGGGLKQ